MALVTNTIDLDSPDDVALADRMKSGRDRIVSELTGLGYKVKRVGG